jgi:hypothetical protein
MNDILHLIQFDSKGETFVYWPDNERDRDEGLRHLREIGAPDYTVRSRTYTATDEGHINLEWITIASAGKYFEKKGVNT